MSTAERSGLKRLIARVLRRALVPTGLAVTIALTLHTLVTGAPPAAVFRTTGLAFLVALTLLELWVGRWRPGVRSLPRDALFIALSGGLDTVGRVAAAQVAMHVGDAGFGAVARVPLWLSIPLGLIVADGVAYAIHRAFHSQPLLWRVHALHHLPRELYALMSTVPSVGLAEPETLPSTWGGVLLLQRPRASPEPSGAAPQVR